jgi:cyclophilin family peptidyl-prolyl cis-trans isomerase
MYPFDWGLSGDALSYFIQLKLFEGAGLQYDNPPPQVLEEGNDYFAVIQTEKGDIVIDLFEDRVPVNTNSFAFLAQEDWYQGVTFHRVIEGFVAQAGDPTGSGMMGPGYQCDNEIVPDLNYDQPGMVGIANAGPNTGSSQFFITMDALPQLNGGYTIIGEVVEGMDVVQSLTLRDPQQNPNAPPGDVIEDIVIEVR